MSALIPSLYSSEIHGFRVESHMFCYWPACEKLKKNVFFTTGNYQQKRLCKETISCIYYASQRLYPKNTYLFIKKLR